MSFNYGIWTLMQETTMYLHSDNCLLFLTQEKYVTLNLCAWAAIQRQIELVVFGNLFVFITNCNEHI